MKPGAVDTLMPMPLSSQTKRIGTGRRCHAAEHAALTAPIAVEWPSDASPKLHTTIASAGVASAGAPSPSAMRLRRSIATAAPTAFGRCDAMVDVCGGMHSRALPKTLWRPPAMGSSRDATIPSSTSRTAFG